MEIDEKIDEVVMIKKLILLTILVYLFSIIQAQNVITLFKYLDNMEFNTPLLMPDGKTPVPDSCLIEICLLNSGDQPDFLNDPHGKDLQNDNSVFYTNGEEIDAGPGYFYCLFYYVWIDINGKSENNTVNCGDNIYFRMYDTSDPRTASYYRESTVLTGPLPGVGPHEIEISSWGIWKSTPK